MYLTNCFSDSDLFCNLQVNNMQNNPVWDANHQKHLAYLSIFHIKVKPLQPKAMNLARCCGGAGVCSSCSPPLCANLCLSVYKNAVRPPSCTLPPSPLLAVWLKRDTRACEYNCTLTVRFISCVRSVNCVDELCWQQGSLQCTEFSFAVKFLLDVKKKMVAHKTSNTHTDPFNLL